MPTITPAGNEWLKVHFGLNRYLFSHSSYIGNNESIELTSKGNIEQVYGYKYAVEPDTPLAHVEFALKYDDLSLDFLKAVFTNIDEATVSSFIDEKPAGRYTRKIGFLYEMLTGRKLNPQKPISGNYIDLLDKEYYIVGKVIKNKRWRINDNLLGTKDFCPIIRRTRQLSDLLAKDIRENIEGLKNEFPDDVFRRATTYLYRKETKSSYEIEKEQPSPDRMDRFINLLTKAGKNPTEEALEKANLIQLQNVIVDPRFAASDFRDFQNYVGQASSNYDLIVHYICPPHQWVESMMKGLQETAAKSAGAPGTVRAAVLSFGFVFIHPFEDGNGRLHRFIIHDTLVYDGLVPQGMIIPVSAHMLSNMQDYDRILEAYSKPLMQRIRYTLNDAGQVTVTNPEEVEGYFRYPDLTPHSIYLNETILATLSEDMPQELTFLVRYDEAKKELQAIVDMPDKDINLMLIFLHRNKGLFPKRRREQFSKLTDDEIEKMAAAYRRIYEIE